MMRVGTVFIAICMALVAGSAGAIVFLRFGIGPWESGAVALATLLILILINLITSRPQDHSAISEQIASLSQGTGDLARQVTAMERRLIALETRIDKTAEANAEAVRIVTDPLAFEMSELSTLVHLLANAVAKQTELTEQGQLAEAPAALHVPEQTVEAVAAAPVAMSEDAETALPAIPKTPARAHDNADPVGTQPTAPRPATVTAAAGFIGQSPSEQAAAIHRAIDANRFDVYLQPIVTLPQRKVRFYEAVARLRTETGEIVPAADFISRAASAGVLPKIDKLQLFRCVQIVRRLHVKHSEVGVFCNMSTETLADAAAFGVILDFLEANRAIAGSLLLEFSQAAWRSMGPIERESIAALAERGYHFSLDNVTDLSLEPRDLAQRHVRYIKIPGGLLLDRAGGQIGDIDRADLSNLLARYGIEVIADRVETEAVVVDLLDYDLRYGQGFLFSQPRPVRAEALQPVNENVAAPAVTAPPAATSAPVEKPPALPAARILMRTPLVANRM